MESEEDKKEEAKKISIQEASAYGIMDGFGIRYITPYAIALGANNALIGFLSAVPGLIGNLSQFYSVRLMEKFSRKKIVLLGVSLQALMWIPIMLIGVAFSFIRIKSATASILLIFFYTLLVFFGAFAGPAWNSWMKDLVTENSGKYFGKRNQIAGLIALIGMLIAGFLLDYFKSRVWVIGFIILFSIAFIGRSVSAYLFTKKYEPELKYESGYYFTFWQFLKSLRKNNFGKFTIFISLMSFATSIASPFFSVYMLRNLNFGYFSYILVVLSSSVSLLIFMPLWGKFADSHGNIKVIKISGMLTILIPLLWFFSFAVPPNFIFIYLIIIEAFAGFVWAGFNLSAGNFIYDAVSRQRMAICVSYFTVINSIGGFAGALIGGFISSSSIVLFGLSSMLIIFLLSSIIRTIILLAMSAKIKEVREVKAFGIKEAKEKILNLKSQLPLIRDKFSLRPANPV